jgi:hypothetical protein
MPREPRDTSDRNEAPPDTTGVEPETLQPSEQEQLEARHLTAEAEQHLATHPPTPDDLQTREDRLDHAEAALHTIEPHDVASPENEPHEPEPIPEPLEDRNDHAQLTVEAERYLADHPPGPEDHDTRDTLLDSIATNIHDQQHDPAPTTDAPGPPEPHEPPPPRLEEEPLRQEPSRNLEPVRDPSVANQPDFPPVPSIEEARLQPQESTNPTPPANLSLERDLQQPHDNQLPARSERKELAPRERLEPARAPSDPLALITAFVPSDAKEGERPSLSQRLAALDRLLDRHPYLCDRPNFGEQYRKAEWYVTLKTLQANNGLASLSREELARRMQVHEITVHNWLYDHNRPRLVTNLVIHENARRAYETRLPSEARNHRLDPALVYSMCKTLKDYPETPGAETIASALESVLRSSANSSRVIFAEFRPYHNHGPSWIGETADLMAAHRPEIQRQLNLRLGLPDNASPGTRLAVVNQTLYIWRRDTNPDQPLNYYANEAFSFRDATTKQQIMHDALTHLNLDANHGILQLVSQLTDHPHKASDNMTAIYDLRVSGTSRHYLFGETLHFLLDASNRSLNDFQPVISQIGINSHYGIRDPRFPVGPELAEFRARAFAIIVSDGHIHGRLHILEYRQKDRDRIAYVESLFREALGNLHTNRIFSPDDRNCLKATVVAGRLLEKWGMPAGEKHLQPQRVPEQIRNGTPRVKQAYLQELISDEGSFIRSSTRTGFVWKRVAVLDAGPKGERYNFSPRIAEEHKELIRQHGKHVHHQICGEPREETALTWRQLKDLASQSDGSGTTALAKQLKSIIESNPCTLLDDEIGVARSMGIKMYRYPEVIHLYENGRVTVYWTAATQGEQDALRWAIMATPSMERKRVAVQEWLAAHSQQANDLSNQLRQEGLISGGWTEGKRSQSQ